MAAAGTGNPGGPTKHVAIVGTGTIGASWAAYFAAQGLKVTAFDPAEGAETRLRSFITGVWPVMRRLGLSAGVSPDSIVFAANLPSAVSGVDFVQENGPEQENLKIELFRQIGAAAPPEAIIASSSSGLLMSRVQDGCAHPERCVTGHPFNPPHLIPLVEVVGGRKTSAETIARTISFYLEIGKSPIHVRKEIRGHIANRLQGALWREAVYLVAQGVASVEDIDTAVSSGPGLRWAIMGPTMTFHLGGGDGGIEHFLDHLGAAVESWWDDLGDVRLTPEVRQTLIAGVRDAAGGRGTPELASERDRILLDILQSLRK